MPTVWVPPPLQDLTGGQGQISAHGQSVRELIEDLERKFPGMRDRLCQGDQLRRGIAVSVDGLVSSQGVRTLVRENSEVHFLPAISGGRTA